MKFNFSIISSFYSEKNFSFNLIVMQNIIKTFINGAISAYMVEVNKSDISGSLTQKNLVISQLDIYPDALLQHGIPLFIKNGSIKNVVIHIPTKFKTDPILITIDSVTILAVLSNNNPTPETIANMKLRMLKAYKYFRKCYKLILALLSNNSFLSVFRTIISNVIMEIKHIHVQIEYLPKESSDQIISRFSYQSTFTKSDTINSEGDKKEDIPNNDEATDEYSSGDSTDFDDFVTENLSRFSLFENTKPQPSQKEEKVTSIGIVIPKLVLHNPANLESVSNKKIVKEAVFSDLGIYMDVDVPPIDTSSKEKCAAELSQLYESQKHNWILKPFSFSGLIKFNKNDPQIFFEPVIEKVIMNLKEQYIPLFLDLMKTFDSFQKKFSVAHIPRPSFSDPQAFWLYCHKCAVSKISNATFDFSQKLNLLLKRVIFLKNYKKKNQRSLQIIRKMEEELDYTTIVAFRAAYRLIQHKKRKGKKKRKISAKTTKKIIKEIRIDPVHIVRKIVTNFALNFKGGLVTINLKRNSGKNHISVDLKNIKFAIEKDLKSTLIHASGSSVCVKYKKEKEVVVFRSIDNDQIEMKLEVVIPFLSYSNWLISLQISQNNYTVNLDALLQIVTDLSLINLCASDISRLNLLAFIKTRHIELNIQVLSSVIKVVGSRSNRAIQYAFDNLSFTTDPKTLEKTLKFSNAWISLITDTEAKVSTDFSLTGTLVGNNISLNIPLFSCAIPFKYIVVIQDFINLFMKYQALFRVDSFPKIDVNFNLEMKGMNVNIKIPHTCQTKTLQIRKIILKFKNSVFKFRLKSIELADLFSLKHLTAVYDQKSINVKLAEVSAKVMELIAMVPKDALEIINNQNKRLASKNDLEFTSTSDTNNEYDSNQESVTIKHDSKSIELPKIKIGCLIEKFRIQLSITNKDQLILNVKDINASIDNNKLNTYATLDQITCEDMIISKQILYKSEVIFDQITEILIHTDNCDLNINKKLANLLLNINVPSQEIALPHDIGIKLVLMIDNMSISNDLVMKYFTSDLYFINSKIDTSISVDSIDSSIVKFKSKDVVQMSIDIKQNIIDLAINLEKITIFVIPLIDVLSLLSKSNLPTTQNNLRIKVNPIQFNFCFGENYLNVIFESPIKLKVNTLHRFIPYIYLQVFNFSINLNNDEIIEINSLKFILDKNMVVDIPSIKITLSMLKIYQLIKMISLFTKSSFANAPKKILIYQIPIETIRVNVPLIKIIVHQTKSRRCISLTFENTDFDLKNQNQRAIMFAQTKILFSSSDGFTSTDLAPPFKILSKGELSETKKNCSIKALNPVKFEISTNTINQILKNLTATEDEIRQPYSIMNETGTEITLIVNNNEYILKSQEHLPNVTNFADSDIKLKIGSNVNPIQIYTSFSKISFPLFFGKHFILVWIDSTRLQLKLLSPISFKNNSNTNLNIQFNNQLILLHKKETFCLDFTIEKLHSIIVKSDSESQLVELNKKSVIQLDNKFIIVSKKREIETLHTVISFDTPYYFRNELISTITISIKTLNGNKIEKIKLKPTKIVPVPFFKPDSEAISFDILDSNDIKKVHIELNLNELKDKKQFIKTTDSKGKEFILQFSFNSERMDIISISPFLIYYSSLSIPVVFGFSPDEPIESEKKLNCDDFLSQFFPIQTVQSILNFDNPSMLSPVIEQTKKVDIYISSEYSNQWALNPFTISNFDVIKDLTIPLDDEKVSLAHCHALYNSHLNPNTFIFFIIPQYLFYNQTNETFSINLFDGKPIEIPPNSTIPITFIRKSLNFSIAIVEKSKAFDDNQNIKKNLNYSGNINLEKINSQYIKIHPIEEPVLLQLSIEKEIHFITFMLNRTLPYSFVNNTDYKVFFFQKNTPDSSHIVNPNQSVPFFLFDENMPTIIYCEISNIVSFEIDINQLSFPSKIEATGNKIKGMNLYYYVDLSTNEGSTITLCNVADNEISISKNLNLNSTEYFTSYFGISSHFDESYISVNVSDISRLKDDIIHLSIDFSHLSFLIITNQFQELCNLTLKDIHVDSSINEFITKTKIFIGTVKLDDQNQYAIYPSIFQILPNGDQPAIQFGVDSFGCHKYGKFELNIQPVNVRIDLSFISDFIGHIFYIDEKDASENGHENEKIKFEFKMNDIPLTEIIRNLMPEQVKYHINHILIHQFIVYLSFHSRTTRSYHPLQNKFQIRRIVNFIPSFDNVAITIYEPHSFRNLSGTTYEILYKISHEIRRMIIEQLSIKNPKEKLHNVVEFVTKPEMRKIMLKRVLMKAASILSFAESFLCYLSSMLDIYTSSPPKNRTDETSLEALKWGFSAFISSLKEGAKKLVYEPIERGKNDGKNDFCGYLIGAGIGITKFVAHFVSGICNFGASLFSSMTRVFSEKKVVFYDERECEPTLGMHYSNNEHLLWYTRSSASGLIEVYNRSIYIEKENKLIQTIIRAEIKNNSVTIFDVDQNSHTAMFDDENQVVCFYNIVESQLLRKKIFEIPDDDIIENCL